MGSRGLSVRGDLEEVRSRPGLGVVRRVEVPEWATMSPEGMRIPPLRSAVQMGSDVSLDGQ